MQTLLELQKDLEAELELMNEFARENLKSYQVWWVFSPRSQIIRCYCCLFLTRQAPPPQPPYAHLARVTLERDRLHPHFPPPRPEELPHVGVPPLALLALFDARADQREGVGGRAEVV